MDETIYNDFQKYASKQEKDCANTIRLALLNMSKDVNVNVAITAIGLAVSEYLTDRYCDTKIHNYRALCKEDLGKWFAAISEQKRRIKKTGNKFSEEIDPILQAMGAHLTVRELRKCS